MNERLESGNAALRHCRGFVHEEQLLPERSAEILQQGLRVGLVFLGEARRELHCQVDLSWRSQ